MPYVVIVYDVQADRTTKYLKFLRSHLIHVQNSVFEGELSEGRIEEIKFTIEEMLEDGESVVMYRVSSSSYVDRTVYGTDPAEDHQFL